MIESEVPQLNLAPKRRKLLSLWNPLDYLQLLGWVFFFPQAVRWYGETYGNKRNLQDCKTWSDAQQRWRTDSVLRNLWIQSLILIVLVPVLIAWDFGHLGVPILVPGVVYGIVFGIVILADSLMMSRFFANAVAIGIVYSVLMGVSPGISNGTFGLFSIVFGGISTLILWGVSFNILMSAKGGISIGFAGIIVSMFATGIIFGVMYGTTHSIASSVLGAVFFAGQIAGIVRPELWLATTFSRRLLSDRFHFIGHTTPIPFPGLTQQLSDWLARDWTQAVYNANELLAYTQQFIPVVNAINRELSQQPHDALLHKVAILAANPLDWDIVKYASLSLPAAMKTETIEAFGQRRQKGETVEAFFQRSRKDRCDFHLRLDTPARAAAAGFWYLHENQPQKAAAAFFHVRHLPNGEEMYQLASSLSLALQAEKLNGLNLIENLSIPTSQLFRADTWPAISCFRSVVEEAQIVAKGDSQSVKSKALNRALGKLTEVLDKSHLIPKAERTLIVTIANSWKEKILL